MPSHQLVVADATLRHRLAYVVATGRLVASSTSTTTYHLAQREGTRA